MKKYEIEQAIQKNLKVLKYEELNAIRHSSHVGDDYLIHLFGVKPIRYDDIDKMYQDLDVTGCDCKLLLHYHDYDDEDSLIPSSYPFIDECMLCHHKFYEPRKQSIWFRQKDKENRIGEDYDSTADIKFKLFMHILEYIKDYKSDDEIDLYEVIREFLNNGYSFNNKFENVEYFIDDRKKDNYKMLIVLGSNDIKLGDNTFQPAYQRNLQDLIRKLSEGQNVKIDILYNNGYGYISSNRNTDSYRYNDINDVELFFNKLEQDQTKYDMVLDMSNIKKIEEIDGKYLVTDYDIKDKVDADYFYTLRDSSGMSEEQILEDANNHDVNEKVFYHDFHEEHGHFESYFYPVDGEIKQKYGDSVIKDILGTLFDESKVSLEEKNGISRRLSRSLKTALYNKP